MLWHKSVFFLMVIYMRILKILPLILMFPFLLSSCSLSDDFEDSKKKTVAVVYESVYEDVIKEEFPETDEYTFVSYNSLGDAVRAIENGLADFTVVDSFDLKSLQFNKRSIIIKEKADYSINYCAYFKKENEDFKVSFDSALKALKSNGELDEIEQSFIENGYYENDQDKDYDQYLVMLCSPYFEDRIYLEENGNIAGIDYEIAKAVCNELGYGLKTEICEFDEMFIDLDRGEGDFVMGGTEFTSERAQYYSSSDYYYTNEFFVVQRGEIN